MSGDGCTRRVEIKNSTASLAEVRELVKEGIEGSGFPKRLLNRVSIAVDEAVTNIIDHAYPDVPENQGTITLSQDVDERRYRIEIMDDGMLNFDPQKVPTVDIARHVQAGRDTGLGVFLMRRIMDVVEYTYERDRCNKLVLVKFANSEDTPALD